MSEQPQPQDQPQDAVSPVPNRRERRGKKSSGAPAPHGGKFVVPNRSTPAVPSRQYSTRRRSG